MSIIFKEHKRAINCFDEFLLVNEDQTQLKYIIDQCLHCRIGNPVIIFENGRFPVFT